MKNNNKNIIIARCAVFVFIKRDDQQQPKAVILLSGERFIYLLGIEKPFLASILSYLQHPCLLVSFSFKRFPAILVVLAQFGVTDLVLGYRVLVDLAVFIRIDGLHLELHAEMIRLGAVAIFTAFAVRPTYILQRRNGQKVRTILISFIRDLFIY